MAAKPGSRLVYEPGDTLVMEEGQVSMVDGLGSKTIDSHEV